MPTFEFRIPQDFALCRKKGRDNLAAKNESQNRPINNEEEEKKKKRKLDKLTSLCQWVVPFSMRNSALFQMTDWSDTIIYCLCVWYFYALSQERLISWLCESKHFNIGFLYSKELWVHLYCIFLEPPREDWHTLFIEIVLQPEIISHKILM